MPTSNSVPDFDGAFHVDYVPRVGSQIGALAERAAPWGMKAGVLDVLAEIVEKLKSDPCRFGEPSHHAKHKGGVVYNGILDYLRVHFVVFEAERTVILLDLIPMPGSIFDPPTDD
jgi:hypothetical protein